MSLKSNKLLIEPSKNKILSRLNLLYIFNYFNYDRSLYPMGQKCDAKISFVYVNKLSSNTNYFI